MDRWWDDPATAVAVLDRVDDSDVVQGVGTAVLGYHALAKAVVAPLAEQTLVDPADVQAALGRVDLAPVAKALGEATRPMMGAAADRYGQLLAEQVHADAAEGAEHMLRMLGAQNVPMPLAVARVAEVVGVPARHVGQYVEKMKAPTVPVLVCKDAADRALMGFAAHAGSRESSPVVPVSKAAFAEAEHPRDEDGQFRDKAGSTRKPPSKLAALRARNRRAAQVKRRAVQAAAPVERREVKAAPRRELGAAPRREVGAAPRRELKGLLRREVKAREPVAAEVLTSTGLLGEVKAAPKRSKPLREMKQANPFHQKMNPVAQDVNIVDDRHRRTMFIPQSVARELQVHGSADVGMLERVLERALVVHELSSKAQEQMAVDAGLPGHDEPLVTVVIEGAIPVRDGTPGTDEGVTLATDARLVMRPASAWNDSNVLTLSWDMEGFEGAPRITEKSAAFAEAAFEEADHPRDGDGQFTRKPRTRLAAYRARQKRAYARRTASVTEQRREVSAAPRRELGDAPRRELGVAPRREVVGRTSLVGLKRQAAASPKAAASSAHRSWDAEALDLKKARAMVVSSHEFYAIAGVWPDEEDVHEEFVGEPEPDMVTAVFPRVTDGLTAVHEAVTRNDAVTWTDGNYPTRESAVRGVSDYLAELQAAAGPNTEYSVEVAEVTTPAGVVYRGVYRETNSDDVDTIILGDHDAVVSGGPVRYRLLAEGRARDVLAQFGRSMADADLTGAQKDAIIRVYDAERVHD
jgi:hypothetical protein